jgi:3-polyprenyl-4-hydroxybenzoate decarboxylase
MHHPVKLWCALLNDLHQMSQQNKKIAPHLMGIYHNLHQWDDFLEDMKIFRIKDPCGIKSGSVL